MAKGSSSSTSLVEEHNQIKQWRPTNSFYLSFASLFFVVLAATISATSMSVALTDLAKHLKLTDSDAFLVGSLTSITATVIQPSCASWANAFGRRESLAGGLAFLLVGSILGAVASDAPLLFVARSLQGIGEGGSVGIIEIMVTEMVPLRLRGKWLAWICVASAIGTVSGPLLGGLLSQVNDWSWRMIFVLNAGMTILSLLLTYTAINPKPRQGDILKNLRDSDWAGLCIFCTAILLILVPLTQGGSLYSWTDRRTIIPLCFGSVSLVAFILYEMFVPANPMIPPELFRNLSCVATFIACLVHGLVLWCLLYYLPIYYEGVKGYSSIQTGVAVLPETMTISLGSIVSGVSISHTGRYRWAIWSAWVATTVSVGTLYFLGVNSPAGQWVPQNLLVGFGLGMIFGAMGFAVQAAVSHDLLAIAVTLTIFFRSLGTALGVPIGGVIFTNELKTELLIQLPSNATDKFFQPSFSLVLVAQLRNMNDSSTKSAIIAAVSSAVGKLWIYMSALCGAALLVTLGIKHFSLDVDLPSEKDPLPRVDDNGLTDDDDDGSIILIQMI
ncbi:hypothetical protein PFICI_11724 [Pestalotiopsis fici W106-1]|uniref:Major facilitator superfamily (MFS) profile domain-containing protein n=1 Tax=Pestalotiopsis fici (strain W106-1 / CGMCC3.15140) TaxID=1229662 RepID=W3WT72_PESFW|nr:uncharacterized protein PFICI_11724 [Pestalotiopsis fici W106-1]ETS76337.1 hypothetical protein PFICI_11724 [Pestalotiopsis fici W106-1]